MSATATDPRPKAPPSRAWFIVAAVAAIVALGAGALQWVGYQKDLRDAAQAYRFKHVEVVLNQPPFGGISTQIEGEKWLPSGPSDIVKDPESISLYDTITLKLQPLAMGADCSPSDIAAYQVLLDAPGFTVDKLGDALRSRQTLLAPACSVSRKAPPPAEPWRWNLMATQPGNHVVTLLMQALDKNRTVIDSREVDIPVFVPTPPQTLASNIGLISVLVTIVTALIGLWERFRPKPTV
ncbi:MAG: hypothetical protein WA814_09410 [Candidatus Baltobacteraceae bacterium]